MDRVKYSPGKYPNSQKNLRFPWRKGQRGNPRGRPLGGSRKKLLALLDEDLKAEAQEILLQAFARGEPWAVELIREK